MEKLNNKRLIYVKNIYRQRAIFSLGTTFGVRPEDEE